MNEKDGERMQMPTQPSKHGNRAGCPTLRLLISGGLWLVVAGTVGCAQDFRVRRVEPGKVAASGQKVDPSWGWSAGQCLAALSKNETRRRATERLVELYAPAMLAAPATRSKYPPGRAARSA